MLAPLFIQDLLSGAQSALNSSGPNAGAIAQLSWIMFAGGGLILALIVGLVAYALMAPPASRAWLAHRNTIIVGGIFFPVVVLSILLVYGLALARDLVREGPDEPLIIEVVGEQFWWRVRYPESAGRPPVVTANEIHVPTGRPIKFVLTTADVIHSFWVPPLSGKLDMIPGVVNVLLLRADRPGVYRGQCAEFCGAAHAQMALYVVAHTPEEFETWMEAQQRPAIQPATADLQRGRDLFLRAGCGGCHTVRGTPASGRIGPDLTHIGSRLSIAAGMFPNHQGTLAGWIADSQHLKPENKMPSFAVFSGEELRATAAYLESLK